ncbi:MAG: ribosome recycling factor [Fibrobacterota bacterium]
MAEDYKKTAEEKMSKSYEALQRNLSQVRTGRANASVLDGISVEYYGTQTPLNQVASIGVPEARLITIQPWDKGSLPAIEKAIMASNIGLTPSNDGTLIRLNVPKLTEDRRKDLVKHCKKLAEDGRVSVRNNRRDINDAIKAAEKNGELTEDDRKQALDDVQTITDSFIAKIDKTAEEKEKEILEV